MTRDRAGRIAATAVAAILPLGFLAVFFAVPVSAMLVRGFAPDGVLDLTGFGEVLGRARTQRIVGFTLAMSAAATVLAVLLGVPVAHTLYRLAVPGRRVLRAIVAMPFVLPTVVVGVMFRSLLGDGGPLGGIGLDGHWGGILAAFVFFNLAVVVRTVGAAWEGLDRRPEEAAAALGASPAVVLRTVTLPALAPSIVSAASVVFLFCATAFGVVLTMGKINEPPEVLGHSIGAALVGTFLGVLGCYGFVGPLATNMEHQIKEEESYYQVIRIALVSYVARSIPQIAIEFARRAIPESERPSFTEMEKIMKGKGK